MEQNEILIQAGKYRHYKGGFYKVIGVARHSETEEEMVVYKSMDIKHQLWVRPLEMFKEKVKVNGKLVPRFQFISSLPESEEE